ncbi:hypothetical protein D1114_20735 [Cereibacter sphaeroides]|uniref:TnsA endonuclease N-terminal domain-containing protein n=1 Tax=Cereibacter sphaeroides TaxID=1063 RepID=A0AAX1UFH2_CERSP|nr:hypothetical protein [Cereibacter sphaeroides]RDS93385.1 hypothetical protein DWF04_23185 [Cereibacter sphaeroides f. sp. denitrificans]RHZ91187.1 hypothetical protein D1114_20735 [Cereibacter sphaeroides]
MSPINPNSRPATANSSSPSAYRPRTDPETVPFVPHPFDGTEADMPDEPVAHPVIPASVEDASKAAPDDTGAADEDPDRDDGEGDKEIVLPSPSRADRDVPAASAGHCTGHSILGDGEGVRMQAESWLELCHLFLLNAMLNVAHLQEQVRFFYGWDPKHPSQHVFDVVATLTCGTRVAFAIKPEVRLVSGRFMAEMQEVAWWVNHTRFADEVRLLTEADIDPVDLHNARIIAAVRAPDPWADDAASRAISALHGARTLRDLTHELGMAARGYRAFLRLIRRGVLRPMRREAITPSTLVLRKEAF